MGPRIVLLLTKQAPEPPLKNWVFLQNYKIEQLQTNILEIEGTLELIDVLSKKQSSTVWDLVDLGGFWKTSGSWLLRLGHDKRPTLALLCLLCIDVRLGAPRRSRSAASALSSEVQRSQSF